jgi:hypothetical protein
MIDFPRFKMPDDQSGKVIEATAFRLVDSKGRTRAVLGLSDDEEPYLLMNDESGDGRLGIWIDAGQAEIVMTTDFASVTIVAAGEPRITLHNVSDDSIIDLKPKP